MDGLQGWGRGKGVGPSAGGDRVKACGLVCRSVGMVSCFWAASACAARRVTTDGFCCARRVCTCCRRCELYSTATVCGPTGCHRTAGAAVCKHFARGFSSCGPAHNDGVPLSGRWGPAIRTSGALIGARLCWGGVGGVGAGLGSIIPRVLGQRHLLVPLSLVTGNEKPGVAPLLMPAAQ